MSMTESGGGGNPLSLRVTIHNAEIGTNVARKTSFRGKSWSIAKRRRRCKDEESEYMGKQCKTGESRSYCSSNSNASTQLQSHERHYHWAGTQKRQTNHQQGESNWRT